MYRRCVRRNWFSCWGNWKKSTIVKRVKNKNNQNKNNQQNQNNQDKMSKDNAEQLLNAAIQQEKDTKRKMQKAMSQPRRKQYEKNW